MQRAYRKGSPNGKLVCKLANYDSIVDMMQICVYCIYIYDYMIKWLYDYMIIWLYDYICMYIHVWWCIDRYHSISSSSHKPTVGGFLWRPVLNPTCTCKEWLLDCRARVNVPEEQVGMIVKRGLGQPLTSGKHTYKKTIENHHFEWENSL